MVTANASSDEQEPEPDARRQQLNRLLRAVFGELIFGAPPEQEDAGAPNSENKRSGWNITDYPPREPAFGATDQTQAADGKPVNRHGRFGTNRFTIFGRG